MLSNFDGCPDSIVVIVAVGAAAAVVVVIVIIITALFRMMNVLTIQVMKKLLSIPAEFWNSIVAGTTELGEST